MPTISEETQALLDAVEPDFQREGNFTIEAPAPAIEGPPPKRRGGPGRGHKGPQGPAKRKPGRPPAPIASSAAAAPAPPPEETPKALINGCRWMLRNIVTIMKEAYQWDEPEDYKEWLIEASELSAKCVQKHFPDWMAEWGDEILLLAMLMLWATPNVSKQLRERKKPHLGNAGQEGQRQDNPTVSLAQSA